ncbi:RNA polymerase subunit sigma-24 [Paenibacillus helianthi]|uniref:RNA polymerase subunit sigma-24 n=1 Tax=Paenibacillus helianthi TaxID=1349432 RepID=A0ABX3ES07_9BACL|nr:MULTISPECIES: RNA polymerase sigma factor [Paenibacillus]OKP66020.1 RNA polymerase subunit sigma-24 [Paenibacillus sp. P3E]OKP87731.1 RNA polymerase subunit sigma-24 [Paenibacillus helianthi]OKP93394.1 RNA polymerase subunit sigma-24 [Paenibacillus sp. P32E]
MVDAELYHIIHGAKDGNQEAFAELVRRYKGHVYRYAVGMLNSRMDAEDVSQEAFVKAFYSLSGLDNEYAFSSWMMTIVSNLCKDRLKKRNKEQDFRDEPDECIADSSVSDPLAKLSVEESLARLSVDHREVILLHDVQGYQYEEIAKLLNVPIGTVKSRLFTARMSLRKELAKEDQE